jgi:hypothetical protein
MAALGGSVDDGSTLTFLARPDARNPVLLLPVTPTAAAVTALRRHHDARTIGQRLAGVGARLTARAGSLTSAGGDVVELATPAVVAQLRRLFGEADLKVAISVGPPRRNRKPVIMMMRDDGELLGYAKVGWSDFTRRLVDNEFTMLQRVVGHLPPPLRAPTPLARLEMDHLVIAVTSSLLPARPSRRRHLSDEDIAGLARCTGSTRVPVASLGWLAEPRFGSRSDTAEGELQNAVASVRDRLADETVEVGIWHGDLNPWNLITAGARLGLIDWEFAGNDRPIGQDLRHLRLERIRRVDVIDPTTAVDRFVAAEHPTEENSTELALYLADMAIRESQLSGQGWDGAMSGFRVPLTRALESLVR